MNAPLHRRLAAEGLGTAMLLATVVGSGIMGARLANGLTGLALLANALATGAMLVVLILIFGPLSGAHFNPIVSLAEAFRRNLRWKELWSFCARSDHRSRRRRLDRSHHVRSVSAGSVEHDPHRTGASGSPRPSPPSDFCSRSLGVSPTRRKRCPKRWGFISWRPTGSRHRRRLPIPR